VPERVYRFLLWLYPPHFREEYGGEMARLFRDRCVREGSLRVSMEVLSDLVLTVVREHMHTLWSDIQYSVRTLMRNPGFGLTALLTLALGIGANTAIFSVVKGVVLDPLPYRDPARLVQLYEKRPKQGRVRNVVSPPDFADWKSRNTVFESMAAMGGGAYSLAGPNGAELLRACTVSDGFLRLVGVSPLLGRDFLPEEQTPGKDRVVLLTHGLWQRRFGGDPKIVGRKITLSGNPFLVVGVLPEFHDVIRGDAEIWKPLAIEPEIPRAAHMLSVFGRLKPGVTLARARTEMDTLAARLEQQYPNENTGHGVNVFSLNEEIIGNVRPALLILLGAVGLVLLIACANVANLYLARTAQRRREISIRTALGAGSGRLARQLLTESLLLSLLGGGAGVLLAVWGVHAIVAANPGNLPRLEEIDLDQHVLGFALAISLLTGILFGIAPAWHAATNALAGALKEVGRGSTGATGRAKARGILVVAEVALALLLSIGAGLMVQSFDQLAGVNPGFRADHVLAVDVALTGPQYTKAEARAAFFRDLQARARTLPGVLSVGATAALPLTGRDSGTNFVIEGRPPLPYSQQPNTRFRPVTAGYFETMQIPLRAGRFIGAHDTETAPQVVVVNETFARQFWPNDSPVGKRIAFSGEKTWIEIVGIAGDVKHYALDGETRPEMYYPYVQRPQYVMSVVMRTSTPPEALAGAMRRQIIELDREQPVGSIRTLDDLLSRSVAQPRFYSFFLGIFSAVAMVLAAVGIYGVMSFSVGQRTHELGLRMALGASAGTVRGMVLREGLLFAGVGVAIGIGGALALTRVMGKLLYGIAPRDPVTYVSASLLLAVAAAACYIPARRATRVDPMAALRSE
jgi:putative ABC transport system permease protein